MAEINKKSKKILELLAGRESGKKIEDMAFPVQLGCHNYYLLVQDILNLVTKELLGLGNVDNTADNDKPISLLVARALAAKADLQHSHSFSEIDGLNQQLAEFFHKNDQIPIGNLAAVTEALSFYALKTHGHVLGDIQGLEEILNSKAESQHNHTLSQLQGYDDLMNFLNNALNEKLTAADVGLMIDQKLQDFVVDLGDNIVREIPGEW